MDRKIIDKKIDATSIFLSIHILVGKKSLFSIRVFVLSGFRDSLSALAALENAQLQTGASG
ncbi:MAG: hypothetical protein ABSG68_10920 [Thermoguttaceae bacterium]